jgi:hypothetical protein
MATPSAPSAAPAAAPVVLPAAPNPAPAAPAAAAPLKTSLRDIINKTYEKAAQEAPPPAPAPAAPAAAPASPAPSKPQSILSRKPVEAPPAPAAAPVASADTDLPTELPAETPEPTKVNWRKSRELERSLKAQLAAKEQELVAIGTQLKTYKDSTPADLADSARLKSEHQALLDEIAVVKLESHPDFKKQFIVPRDQAIAAAKEVLGYNGKETVDPAALLSLPLKEFNAKVAEATKDMNSMDATTVQTALRTAYTANISARNQLKNSSQIGQEMVAKQAQEAKQAFEGVMSKVSELLVPIEAAPNATPEEQQQAAAHNQAVQNFRLNAEKNAFSPVSHAKAAEIAAKAAMTDYLVSYGIPSAEREFNKMRVERDAAIAENNALKGARRSGPVTGDNTGTPAAGAKPKSLKEIVEATFNKR